MCVLTVCVQAEQRFSDGYKWAQNEDGIVMAFNNFKSVEVEGVRRLVKAPDCIRP